MRNTSRPSLPISATVFGMLSLGSCDFVEGNSPSDPAYNAPMVEAIDASHAEPAEVPSVQPTSDQLTECYNLVQDSVREDMSLDPSATATVRVVKGDTVYCWEFMTCYNKAMLDAAGLTVDPSGECNEYAAGVTLEPDTSEYTDYSKMPGDSPLYPTTGPLTMRPEGRVTPYHYRNIHETGTDGSTD